MIIHESDFLFYTKLLGNVSFSRKCSCIHGETSNTNHRKENYGKKKWGKNTHIKLKKWMPGPVEATSSTLEVAVEDSVCDRFDSIREKREYASIYS